MRLTLVTPNFSSNSFGRTYVLWRLARVNGFDVSIVSPSGGEIWTPLRDDEIVADCRGIGRGMEEDELARTIERSDLVIAVKPVPASFGAAEPLARRSGTPMAVDIDDPDLPPLGLPRLVARQLVKPAKYLGDTRVRLRVNHYPHFVSNPVLKEWHSGIVIPHARQFPSSVRQHTSAHPTVAFVGTNHPHKGLADVRAAVASVQSDGVTLIATDTSPPDAKPWERWVGRTSLSEGLALVAESDIVLLPSHHHSWSDGQLPAKLVDAMVNGRAIAVSDIGPMTWALGDTGRVVRPGDVDGLAAVLREYLSPQRRQELGERARARAKELFTEAAVAPLFGEACEAIVDGRWSDWSRGR